MLGSISGAILVRPNRERDTEQSHRVNWIGWYKTVEDCTARSITKHTGRLSALSGLAQAVSQATRVNTWRGCGRQLLVRCSSLLSGGTRDERPEGQYARL